jgi:hypothetical protein
MAHMSGRGCTTRRPHQQREPHVMAHMSGRGCMAHDCGRARTYVPLTCTTLIVPISWLSHAPSEVFQPAPTSITGLAAASGCHHEACLTVGGVTDEGGRDVVVDDVVPTSLPVVTRTRARARRPAPFLERLVPAAHSLQPLTARPPRHPPRWRLMWPAR